MRIISGRARGRRLLTLKGQHTRPTADRVKEAVFSTLTAYLAEARVLDAFAGSGALGLEAMSRGAAQAVFIEADFSAAGICAKNISLLGFDNCRLIKGDCFKVMAALSRKQQFDLIFLDPPYNRGLLNQAMTVIAQQHLLSDDGIVVAETTAKDSEFSPDENWRLVKSSTYGITAVHYCCYANM